MLRRQAAYRVRARLPPAGRHADDGSSKPPNAVIASAATSMPLRGPGLRLPGRRPCMAARRGTHVAPRARPHAARAARRMLPVNGLEDYLLRKLTLSALVAVATVLICFTVSPAGTNVWTPVGPEGGSVTVLTLDPKDPSTLYLGTDGGGVFKSTNSSYDWALSSTGLPSLNVSALAVDPIRSLTVY